MNVYNAHSKYTCSKNQQVSFYNPQQFISVHIASSVIPQHIIYSASGFLTPSSAFLAQTKGLKMENK